MKNVEIIDYGLKCDNPKCDYRNPDVSIKEYKSWLNRPCPKCGHNLLTKADYDAIRLLFAIMFIMNLIPPIFFRKPKRMKRRVTFDGSGVMKMTDPVPVDEEL